MNKKIYACYSPSHTRLLEEHFLPSIPTGFDVVLRRFDQVCQSGEYKSSNWGLATEHKIFLILEAIERETEPFVFSDVDVRFYDFAPEHLDHDMQASSEAPPDLRCQDDRGSYCSGFMFIRPSVLTHRLFRLVLDATQRFNNDQDALNSFALPKIAGEGQLRVSLLPRERYWNIGPAWDAPAWDGVSAIPNIAMHHGNWVVGLDNKLQLMNAVRELYVRQTTPTPGCDHVKMPSM